METLLHLSAPKCVLLAIRYASDANIAALRAIVRTRHDDLQPALVLRIILTYLPESIDPSIYVPLCSELISGLFEEEPQAVDIDFSSLHSISDNKARSRVHKAQLLPLAHPSYHDDDVDDITNFLIHRAHRIDSETGLFDLVPKLVVPFIEYSDHLRTWFISTCLPLLRQEYEYYPDHPIESSLDSFTTLSASKAVEVLLSRAFKSERADTTEANTIARDIRGLVGPWVYGSSDRKRRKIAAGQRRHSIAAAKDVDDSPGTESPQAQDWDLTFKWIVEKAAIDFPVVIGGIEEWDGPGDVDFGGYEQTPGYLTEELQGKLERRYAQAAFASAYAVEADTPETISGAHSLLVRLSTLMDFEPPPDLATSVDMLPRIEDNTAIMHDTSPKSLLPESLLDNDHPLTSPNVKTFALLQIFIYSAYNLANLGYSMSVKNVAHLRFHSDEDEQVQMLQKILHGAGAIAGKENYKWVLLRKQLVWLWNWGLVTQKDAVQEGFGIFGKIKREKFEKEILKSFLNAGQYELVLMTYINEQEGQILSKKDIESVVIEIALQLYDTASNGNRNRGNMKKVSTIVSTFKPHFPQSQAFKRIEALLAATHSLSFYSLTQQRGVPFQPVSIRVRNDPLSLINDLLEQNPSSYTKLDDLMAIGRNLVAAGVGSQSDSPSPSSQPASTTTSTAAESEAAEQRVLGMTIQASLREDDFETAYSYVVNRMHASPTAPPTSPTSPTHPTKDLSSWRAAFIAGAHSAPSAAPIPLRRLEQRLDLLSQSLLAAPPSELANILTVYTQVEAEMNARLAAEAEQEEAWDDNADRRLPGAFGESVTIQPRREVGRGAAEESPMGLFDVARGAAAAFGRSAGMGARGGQAKAQAQQHVEERDTEEGERVRKRDMIASTVTGGLASGLGWVLGATPVREDRG